MHQPKHCEYNNKHEDFGSNTVNDKNVINKFYQKIDLKKQKNTY